MLALLDLSAAFDTLDHAILLKMLELTFEISGTVLDWFASYLRSREQSVIIEGAMSPPSPLRYGVPQGSVLGPVLFALYSQPLSDVIVSHHCDYHKYADDTELSDSAQPSQLISAQTNIQTCIEDTLSWMKSNKLKLNTDKTEVMPVGSASRLGLVRVQTLAETSFLLSCRLNTWVCRLIRHSQCNRISTTFAVHHF